MSLPEKVVELYVFKAALRDYYYGSEDVKKGFFIPTDDQLMNGGYDMTGVRINKIARDKAFEKFFERVKNSVVMKSDGSPYSEKDGIYQAADDFISGKEILFRGTDSEGFVSIKADSQPWMQQAFLAANSKKSLEDMPHGLFELNHLNTCTIKANCDPRLKEDTMDSEMPKGGSFWNSVVKFFTGHPSARWMKYENYQKNENIKRTMLLAEGRLVNEKELTEEEIKKYQDAAIKEYNAAKVKNQAQIRVDDFEASLNALKSDFRYDEEQHSYIKRSTEERELKRQQQEKEKAELERKQKEEALREEEKKKALQQKEEKKAEPEAKKTEEKVSYTRLLKLRAIKETEGMRKLREHSNHRVAFAEDYFDRAMKSLVYYGQPDAPANLPEMTEDKMAEILTTIYMVGELAETAESGFSAYSIPEDTEAKFGALADELVGKPDAKPITNKIKNYMKESGLAKTYLENPENLSQTFFDSEEKQGCVKDLKRFITAVRNGCHTEALIDDVCEKNMAAHTAPKNKEQVRTL